MLKNELLLNDLNDITNDGAYSKDKCLLEVIYADDTRISFIRINSCNAYERDIRTQNEYFQTAENYTNIELRPSEITKMIIFALKHNIIKPELLTALYGEVNE